MPNIKYHFALDSNNVVPIENVNKVERHLHTYKCMGCGAEMIAKMGSKNAWHFAHKVQDEGNCSSETYLHKLAKRLIREKFESNEHFKIQYHRIGTCSKIKECQFSNKEECEVIQPKTYNLKDYYDTCQEEVPINGFVADLLLTNSMFPEREPVLIEIEVSHKCTDEKLKSGLRIVEIKVGSEDDIITLTQKEVFKESLELVKNPELEKYIQDKGDAKFFNFDRTPSGVGQRNIPRFILFASGKTYIDNANCHKVKQKIRSNSILEVSFVSRDNSIYDHNISTLGIVIASMHIQDYKNCNLCKFYKSHTNIYMESENICCLYKKYNTPKNPQPIFAKQCNNYSPNYNSIKSIKISIPNYIIATDSNTDNQDTQELVLF